jgi:hypothetical protein
MTAIAPRSQRAPVEALDNGDVIVAARPLGRPRAEARVVRPVRRDYPSRRKSTRPHRTKPEYPIRQSSPRHSCTTPSKTRTLRRTCATSPSPSPLTGALSAGRSNSRGQNKSWIACDLTAPSLVPCGHPAPLRCTPASFADRQSLPVESPS